MEFFIFLRLKDIVEGVFLHQKKYAQDILKRFKMSNCNSASRQLETREKLRKETNDEFVSATLYKQINGSLSYLCNIMLDICEVSEC